MVHSQGCWQGYGGGATPIDYIIGLITPAHIALISSMHMAAVLQFESNLGPALRPRYRGIVISNYSSISLVSS